MQRFQPILGQFDAPPESIATGPVASRIVRDRSPPRAPLLISLIEVPAMHERDAHRLKILWADGFIIKAHVFVLSRRVPVDRDVANAIPPSVEASAAPVSAD